MATTDEPTIERPDRLTLEIDLSELWAEGTAGEAIVGRAADLLLRRSGEPRDSLARRVQQITDAEIRAQVAPAIGEAIEKALQPTNSFGEPKGEPLTLRQVIVNQAVEQLKAPDRSHQRGFDARHNGTVLEKIIAEAVASTLTRELQGAIEEAKREVVATIRAKGAEVIAETMRRALP